MEEEGKLGLAIWVQIAGSGDRGVFGSDALILDDVISLSLWKDQSMGIEGLR